MLILYLSLFSAPHRSRFLVTGRITAKFNFILLYLISLYYIIFYFINIFNFILLYFTLFYFTHFTLFYFILFIYFFYFILFIRYLQVWAICRLFLLLVPKELRNSMSKGFSRSILTSGNTPRKNKNKKRPKIWIFKTVTCARNGSGTLSMSLCNLAFLSFTMH